MLWIAAAAIGILVVIVLIYKYTKTSKYDVIGFSTHCKICGDKINGLKCPRCEQKKNDLRQKSLKPLIQCVASFLDTLL